MKHILLVIILLFSINLFAQETEKIEKSKEDIYLEAFFLYNKYDKASQKEAVKKFEKSADMGYAPALMKRGYCFFYGKGVEMQTEKAIAIIDEAFPKLKNSADTDPYAAFEYGMALLGGIGTKPHAYIGYKYILQCAKDFPYAYLQVGTCLTKGYGCEKNVQDALKYYELAKEKGVKEADYYLGHFYINIIGPLKNVKKGIKYLEEADKSKILDATNYLGTIYLNGNGVKKDNDKAFAYFKKASAGEHPRAMYNLGMCYYEGIGCEINEAEAINYILRAAAAGDDKACDMIADKEHEKQLNIK